MPYTANGAWEQLIEGSRKVDFALAIVRTSDTNIPQEKIESVSIESSSVSNNAISFGTTCSDSAKITLREYDSALLAEGAKLKLTASVTNDDSSSSENCQVGMFYVDSIKKTATYGDGYNVEVTAYDGFYKTEQIYSPSTSLGANPTIRAVVTDILQKCGLMDRFGDAFIDETAWSDTITLDSIKADLTCRQQIGYLAALQGCFAKFNDEGNLTAKWYSDTTKIITRDEQYMAEMTQDMKSDITVAMIETGTSDNVIVKPSSALGYSIKFENPYITDSIADSIYTNKVSGGKIKFRPLTVRWRGNPKIVVGDIVKVEDGSGNYLTCYVMQKSLTFDGGMSETYKCYGESTSSVAFNKSPSDVKFERIYSRMEEAIKAATSAVKQTQGSTFELIPETEGSSKNIGYRLYYKDSQDSAFDNCVIMATAGGIGFSTNGGESYDAAAIYFAKDDNGVIHGYINGEFIQAGTISADKVNTSQLLISKGNVEGLESDLTTINNNVSTANSNASTAVSTANEAKDTADSVSGTISDWIYTDHGVTYIDGGKIYTGSIAANSIDVSKLKAGTVNLNGLLINNHWDSSGTYTSLKGWEFLNSTAVIDSTRKLPKLTYKTPLVYTNMIPNSISEFDTSELSGWSILGGAYTKNSGWIQITRTSSWVAIVYKLSLQKWHRYSVSAQVNTVYWNGGKGEIGYAISSSSTASSLNDIEYHYFPNIQNITNTNEEVVIDFSFDYNGETGDRYVGLIFESPQTNQATNIAWIAVSDVSSLNRGTGFYCSYSDWLKSPYKNQTIPKVSSANAYLTSLGKDAGVFPQGMYQPKLLIKGKRYTLFVRLEIPEGSYQDSSPELWLSVGGKKIEFSQINIDPISPALIRAALLKFTFDYDGDTAVKNIGIEWSGFNNYSGTPNYVLFHYFELFQDSVAKLGFFASQSCWLASGYQTNNLITDVMDFKYLEVERSAFEVYDNQLYFRGYVQSEYGDIGCSRLSQKEISIDTGVKVYQDINDTTSMKTLYSSNLRIGVPQNEISSPVDWEGNNAVEFARYVGTTITMSRYNDNVLERETIFAPDGIQFSTSSAKTSVFYDGITISQNGYKVTLLANGINYNGRFISWSIILP